MLMVRGEDNSLWLFNLDGDLIWSDYDMAFGGFWFSDDGWLLSVSGPDDTMALYSVRISVIQENEFSWEDLSEIAYDEEPKSINLLSIEKHEEDLEPIQSNEIQIEEHPLRKPTRFEWGGGRIRPSLFEEGEDGNINGDEVAGEDNLSANESFVSKADEFNDKMAMVLEKIQGVSDKIS